MQSYTEIPSSQSLQSSLALLLNNDKTTLSCSSGSAFPNTNLQVGMLCFRTDQLKLYILKDATPTWMMLLDLNTTGGTAAGAAEAVYSMFIRNSGGANEGGEFRMQKAASGSTLVGDVTVDLYQNNLRFFDSGGTAPGFYIDISAGTANAAAKIWHENNDGAGSGLDADLLDGMQSGNASGNIPVSNGTVNTNLNADMVDGKHVGNGSGNVPLSNGTVNTNLNADTLDGFHAASFVRTIQGVAPDASGNVVVDLASKVSKAGDTMTGDLTIYRSATPATGVVFLGNSGSRYLYYDGTSYNMPGANLIVNGGTVWHTGNIGTPLNGVYNGLSRSGNSVGLTGLHGGGSPLFNGAGAPRGITYDGYGRITGLQNCNCTCTCCFTAGTKVTMADGSVKSVEDVKPGEVVLGLFGQENVVLDQIVCHIEPGHNTYVINGEVRMTGEHLLWTGAGWAAVDLAFYSKWHADRKATGLAVGIDPIKVRQLNVGDRVFNDGALVVVESLEVQVAEADEDLFSFELTGDKTFVANGYGVESKTFTEGFAHV